MGIFSGWVGRPEGMLLLGVEVGDSETVLDLLAGVISVEAKSKRILRKIREEMMIILVFDFFFGSGAVVGTSESG